MDSSSILSNKTATWISHVPDDPALYMGSLITMSLFLAIFMIIITKLLIRFVGDHKFHSFMSRFDSSVITGGKRNGYGGVMMLWLLLVTIIYASRWVVYLQHSPFQGNNQPKLINSYIQYWYIYHNKLKWDITFAASYKIVLILYTSRLQYDGSDNLSIDL